MTAIESIRRDYYSAFLGHLIHRNESSLHSGYEIGRAAVVQDVSMLELATIHHDVFRRVLAETPPEEVSEVVSAASEFFVEILATYHMIHRSAQA
ncbi:MAG TPA: phosphatase RsbU N-terminal domain-containing protein [Microlunatus sp.]